MFDSPFSTAFIALKALSLRTIACSIFSGVSASSIAVFV
jgi:hypothetical protein